MHNVVVSTFIDENYVSRQFIHTVIKYIQEMHGSIYLNILQGILMYTWHVHFYIPACLMSNCDNA